MDNLGEKLKLCNISKESNLAIAVNVKGALLL